jgi:hypothetical protein
MANDITKIPAPRTPVIDQNSGDMTPAWYRYFYNVFVTLGEGSGVLPTNRGGTGQTSYTNGQLLIGNSVTGSLNKNTLTPGTGIDVTNNAGTIVVANTGVLSNIAGAGVSVSGATGNVTIANTGVRSLTAGSGISVSAATGAITIATNGTFITTAPVTKTTDFSVGATDTWTINNKSGSTCTVTLPSPSTNTGRVLYFQNYQAQFLVSASSNVVPRAGGAAGTAILADMAGDTTTLVSDGSNWIAMQYTPNNVLLI